RAGLVDDAGAGLLGLDLDALDLVQPAGHLRVQAHGALDRGLGVELGRVADLEQDVLDHVAAEAALELEGLALHGHVVEAPSPGGQGTGVADAALHGVQGVDHGPAAGVAGGPALARAGLGRVPVGAQGAAVQPAVADGVDDLFLVAAQHVGGDG